MTHLFYTMVVFCLAIELTNLFSMNLIIEKVGYYNSIRKKKGTLGVGDASTMFAVFQIAQYFYMLITILGLMSTQWICFLLILVFSVAFRRFKCYKIIAYSDSILSIIALSFILINKYHLHINLAQLIF